MTTLNKTQEKLISFAYLPIGWNFNKGVPAQEAALKTAITLLEVLINSGFKDTDAFPAEDGSVMVSAYVGSDSYDFDVKVDGTITVAHAREDDDLFYQEGMQVGEAQKKIKEFASEKWPTSDYLISNATTSKNKESLQVTLFKNHPTSLVYLSFNSNALPIPQVESVVTAFSTTPKPQVRRSSFGKSHRKSSRITGR